ncbi:MAG: type 4a pilus biogenesis protein PilO [Planctomycetota bacterium]|nr:type 4a pilus biogenesis protein PilO [Planctomycetota bacterium]
MSKDKQKMALILVVGLVAAAAIGYVWIFKTFGEISNLEAQKETVDVEIKDYEEKISKIKGLQEAKDQLKEVVEDFAKILPDDGVEESYALFEILSQYQDETNIEVDSWNHIPRRGKRKKGERPPAFVRHQFKLRAKGHFFDIARLMNLFERTEKFLRIDSFRCGRPTKGKPGEMDLTKLNMEMTLSTFTYSDVPSSPPPGGKPKSTP